MPYDYRNIDPSADQIVTDDASGTFLGLRSKSGKSLIPLVYNACTFSALLAPSAAVVGQQYFVSDVGVNGSYWYTDGVNWYPVNGVVSLYSNGLQIGVAPGSFGNNGALTVSTALDNIYPNIFLYFPASAIYTGSPAGFYYTVMSSTTLGTVYNNTYSGGPLTIPSNPVAFSVIGPGAYAQTPAVAINGLSFSMPGNVMGQNGRLSATYVFSNNSSAGVKELEVLPPFSNGGGNIFNTTNESGQGISYVQNMGVANAQSNFRGWGQETSTPPILSAINTANAQNIYMQFYLAVATDWIILQTFAVRLER